MNLPIMIVEVTLFFVFLILLYDTSLSIDLENGVTFKGSLVCISASQ